MTTPTNREARTTEVESTSPPQAVSCFGSLIGRKVKKEVPGQPTEAFRREFRANSDHSTDLVRSRPIRYNPETQKTEVATHSGMGVVWKPIQT